MTGDQSLHQAALLVKGMELYLDRLFSDIMPLLHKYEERYDTLRDERGKVSDADHERIREETGFGQLIDNLHDLARSAEWVELLEWKADAA